MSDLGKLDIGDWLGLAVVSIGAGMGSAMTWFSKSNKGRDDRITALEVKLDAQKDIAIALDRRSLIIETCQKNIEAKLEDLKESVTNTAIRGARSVNEQIALMVNELQQLSADIKRRPQ